MAPATELTIVTDSHYFDHDTGGQDHPESPVRLEVIIDALHASSMVSQLDFVEATRAKRSDLLLVHDESWLFRFEEAVLSGKTHIDHSDNQICYDTYEVAALAAGAGMRGVDIVESKEHHVFCVIRPPGHHAENSTPFGFCFYNNALIATRYWQAQYGRKRVAILDFDAHHGNGIQSGTEREADTLYISIHEHPSFSYPGTGYKDEQGLGEGKGSIMNIPLAPSSGDKELLDALETKVAPKLEEWKPDCLIVAAGFDGHSEDYMSGISYSTEVFFAVGQRIAEYGRRYAHNRVLSLLEGGYELSVLGESVHNYVAGLLKK